MIVNPDIEGDIPEEVYTFFRNLDNAVENGNKNAIRNLYEEKFDELTKACYVEGNIIVRPWPSSSLPQVKESFGSELALRLYDFLSNKHLFTYKLLKANSARTTWQNFSDLLRSLPNSSCDLPLSLIWDIFDEFIFQLTTVYQKQYFSEGEWSIPQVFNLLDEVVEKTDVLKSLSDTSTAEELTNNENLSFFSGFYAIITKAKVNVLLGDYYASLSVLTPLNIYKPEKNALQRSGSAALSLFYYIGVSYLMLHRYLDAYHCFMKCMKIKNATAKFAESVRLDAGYMLVCACVLGGIYLPNINMYLQTKKSTFDDDKETLKSGSVDRFGDVFERHSPKFLSVPAAGAQKGKVKGVDGKLLQQRMFNRAVQQQQHVIKMRGYFGVYQNTKVGLLESLLDVEDGYTMLFALKMRSRSVVHDGESADLLSGQYKIATQFDCVVTDDNVEVVKLTGTGGGSEVRLLRKIENIQREIKQFNEYRKNRQEQKKEGRFNHGNQGRGNRKGGNKRPNNRMGDEQREGHTATR